MAANQTGAALGLTWGFNWYIAIFPQIEQQAIFNSVNFSLCPMDGGIGQYSMITAAVANVSALLCPSESATTTLYQSPTVNGMSYGYYSVSNYVGNYGGPAAMQPYTGTIIPGYDLTQGITARQPPADGRHPVHHRRHVEHGPVQRAAPLQNPFGSTTAVYASGTPGLRAIFAGTRGALPGSVSPGTSMVQQHGPLFAKACQSIPSTHARFIPPRSASR